MSAPGDPTDDRDERVGSVLADRYRIDALIGEGGMGKVYRAEHVLMRKRLAVKVLRPELSRVPEIVARFEREAMAAANIDHPNVASATDFGKLPDGVVFLVLEYVQGQSLRDRVAEGPLPVERALSIARQVAGGLGSAHALGIVHRDLKPENVMLIERGGDLDFVKVLDFGIAKVPTAELPNVELPPGQTITKAGMVFGTPEYMAPEQALGQHVDGRADLYSLGVMLFEMLAGVRPFVSKSQVGIVGQQLSRPPPAFAERAKGVAIPRSVELFCHKLLAAEPEQRFQLASDVERAIDALLAPAPGVGGYRFTLAQGSEAGVTSPSPAATPSGEVRELRPLSELTSADVTDTRKSPLPVPSSEALHAVAPAAARSELSPIRSPRAQGLSLWLADLVRNVERARGSWPPPIREPLARLPSRWLLLGSLLLLAAGVLGALVLVSAWLRGSPQASAPAATSEARSEVATAVPGSAAPAESATTTGDAASDAEIQRAAGSGVAALEALAQRFPRDGRVSLELGRALFSAKQYHPAFAAIERSLRLDSKLADSDSLGQMLIEAAQNRTLSDEVFRLLESGALGPRGPDLIYELATSDGSKGPARTRAAAWLSSAAFERQSSPALHAAVALRLAAGCPQKYALLLLVKNVGDARSLPNLRELESTRGCGPDHSADCYPCLRKDGRLGEAIHAVEERAGH